MQFFSRHSGIRQGVAMLLAVVFSAGCVAWHPVADSERYVTAQRPDRVRLDLVNGRQVDVESPAVAGDRIVGLHKTATGMSRVAVQTRNVRTVERWQIDPSGTSLLVSALAVTSIVVIAAVDASHARALKVRLF